eukprot:1030971-Pleurochrysis_carterae.AAC.3
MTKILQIINPSPCTNPICRVPIPTTSRTNSPIYSTEKIAAGFRSQPSDNSSKSISQFSGCRELQTMLSWPLPVAAITRAVGGWRSKGDLVQIDIRANRLCTLKKLSGYVVHVEATLLDPRPGWVLREHPFPSCVGRCLRCSRRFRHCFSRWKCVCGSVKTRSSRVTGRCRRRPSLRISPAGIA